MFFSSSLFFSFLVILHRNLVTNYKNCSKGRSISNRLFLLHLWLNLNLELKSSISLTPEAKRWIANHTRFHKTHKYGFQANEPFISATCGLKLFFSSFLPQQITNNHIDTHTAQAHAHMGTDTGTCAYIHTCQRAHTQLKTLLFFIFPNKQITRIICTHTGACADIHTDLATHKHTAFYTTLCL